ncbi:hypothetical protein MD484_g5300, partial [Candolleomyces efflorescens]
MASSSSSATSPQTPNLSSRFSSLKVFKFGSKEKDGRPPPPPPKDNYYLRNRSMHSLLPDSQSLAPSSPLSPHQPFPYPKQPSPDANHSTMSLASSAASAISSPPPEQPKSRPTSRGKERALAFLGFGKRSPRSPSSNGGPPTPADDENISMPWNFQHNIHVDDSLSGLPPSWTTSLAAHGFTEEDIALLLARRAESRSPGTQNLFNLRPNSPTIAHPYQSNGAPSAQGPLVANPAPRTTSLPRQYSDASLRSGTRSISTSQRPPVPLPQHSASASMTSLHSSRAGSISSKNRLVPQRHPNAQAHHTPQVSVSYSSDSSHYSSGKEDAFSPSRKATYPNEATGSRPHTHNLNGSTSSSVFSTTSSNNNGGHHRNESTASSSKRTFGSQPDTRSPAKIPPIPQPQQPFQRAQANSDVVPSTSHAASSSSAPKLPPPTQTSIQSKRIPGSAPRLSISLHKNTDSADLSSWAGALFEGLSSGDVDGKFTLPTSPQSAPASAAVHNRPTVLNGQSAKKAGNPSPEPKRPLPSTSGAANTTKTTTNGYGNGNGNKPPPLSNLNNGARANYTQYASMSPPLTGELPSSSSPLWSQLEGILGQPVVTLGAPDEQEVPYSAAFSESFSPTLPFSPEEERMAAQRRIRTESRIKDKELDTLGNNEPEDDHRLSVNTMRPNRDSSRSSTSTIGAPAAIVRHVSIARRAGAYVVSKSKANASLRERSPVPPPTASLPTPPTTTSDDRYPPSPLSPPTDSEDGGSAVDTPSSAQMIETPLPTSSSVASPLLYYLQPSPSPSQSSFSPTYSPISPPAVSKDNSMYQDMWEEDSEEDPHSGTSLIVPPQLTTTQASPSPSRPTIVISDVPHLPSSSGGIPTAMPSGTPQTPFQRYRGWLSEVVAPLEDYIDEQIDPRDHYLDLKEIAEGESGSVYSARLTHKDADKLHRLPAHVKAKDAEDIANGREILVAIKSVAIVPSGSPKLNDLRHELGLMRGPLAPGNENLVALDALYVDLLEDTLWIRMELMERSLADVISLVDQGLMLQDRTMARFASDILRGLEYLEQHNIAHRDIRSDNLLVNKAGVLKITDFANAVQVSPQNPMRDDAVGVPYWQAPEVRSPPYNAMKIDVWSLGATVWEMSETEPPFADTNNFSNRWPEVQQPEIHSPAFHEFLTLCSEPPETRPSAGELLKSSFINNACGRPVIVQLLAQCVAIETAFQ